MKLTTLCYIKKAGKTLFLHRNKKVNDVHWDKYIGLGGKMEVGEAPDECIIREVYEESGLSLKQLRLKGVMTFPKFDGREDWYSFLYVGEEFTGEIIESDEGELHWIEDEAIMDLNLWEGDRLFLNWLEQYEFFSAKFIYQEGKLLDYKLLSYIE